MSLWQDRNKQDRVDKIVSELTERYAVNKRFEYEIGTFRGIIKDAYRAMNVLCKDWRCNDIRDRLVQRCGQLNIYNIGCSHVGNVVTVYRHDDNSNIIAKVEYLVEDDYCNINEAIKMLIIQLNRKVA